MTARAHVSPTTQAETSARVRSLTDDKNEFVVASTNYPVLDFATSRHDWINGKVRKKVEVESSGFVKLMVDLCLARIVNHELQWETTLEMECARSMSSRDRNHDFHQGALD